MIRWAARMFIPGLVEMLDTPTAIVNHIVAMNLGYRRQTMFRDVNEYLDVRRFTPAFTAAAKLGKVVDELYARSYTFTRPERYMVTGYVERLDRETGEISTSYGTYYTNEKALTEEESADAFGNYSPYKTESGGGMELVTFIPLYGKKNMKHDMFKET